MRDIYAIWQYDHFPYYLGGEVIDVLESGRVRVKGFDGMSFEPIKLLPAFAGRALVEQLNLLKLEHRKAEAEFISSWRAKVDKLVMGTSK
jgi:hypothetical protein